MKTYAWHLCLSEYVCTTITGRQFHVRTYVVCTCANCIPPFPQLLQWLAEKLPEAGKLPSEFSSFIPPLLSCLEDRSGEVRKHSQTVLPLVMVRVGHEAMVRQASKLKVRVRGGE